MLKRFWTWLRGGRPMARIEYRFRDMIDGKPVYLWQDAYGRYWLANSGSDWFRVKALHGPGYHRIFN